MGLTFRRGRNVSTCRPPLLFHNSHYTLIYCGIWHLIKNVCATHLCFIDVIVILIINCDTYRAEVERLLADTNTPKSKKRKADDDSSSEKKSHKSHKKDRKKHKHHKHKHRYVST